MGFFASLIGGARSVVSEIRTELDHRRKIRAARFARVAVKQKGMGWRDPNWDKALFKYDAKPLDNPYLQHETVYACINKIATTLSSTPYKIYTGPTESPRLVESGPLYKVFNRPNSLWTRFYLWHATVANLQLQGNAVWVLKRKRPEAEPSSIFVYDQQTFKASIDNNNEIQYWEKRENENKVVRLEPFQVIHFKLYNPYHQFWGVGPMTAARMAVEQDYDASQYNAAFFENSAMPGGILTLPAEAGYMTDEEWRRLQHRWEDRHKGATHAHRLGLVEGGASYQPVSVPHKDMQFMEQRKWGARMIAMAFGVPLSELGFLEETHKAAQENVKKGFWQDTIIPLQALIQDTLRAHLFLPYDNETTWGEFDRSNVEVLQDDFAAKVDTAQKLWAMGVPWDAINEKLEMGFESIPGGDVGYRPISLIPADSPAVFPPSKETQTQSDETPDGKEAKKKALLEVTDRPRHTQEQAAYWKAWNRRVEPMERQFKETVRAYLLRMKKWFEKQLASKATVDAIPYSLLELGDKWDRELRLLANKYYGKLSDVVGPMIELHLNGAGIPFTWSKTDPRIIKFLDRKEIKIVDINERVRDRVRDKLRHAQQSNQTVNELQESIYGVMQDSRARSLMIARTETMQASNGMEFESYKAAGVEKHMWLAALDEVTRDSHIQAMAQGPVPLGQVFSNGLLYPGDENAPAEEVVNCRCTLMVTE